MADIRVIRTIRVLLLILNKIHNTNTYIYANHTNPDRTYSLPAHSHCSITNIKVPDSHLGMETEK